MLFKILKYITPLVIVSAAAVAAMLYFLFNPGTAGEAKYMFISGLLVLTGICIMVDLLARAVFKSKIHWIWLSEAIVLLVLVYAWIVK